MTFAEKLRILRQEKGWTQLDLANTISIHREQISSYERGQVIPNTEILIQLAKVFKISIDYLLFEDEGTSLMKGELVDRELLRQFEMLDKLGEKDRQLVKELIELVLIRRHVQNVVNQEITLTKEKMAEAVVA